MSVQQHGQKNSFFGKKHYEAKRFDLQNGHTYLPDFWVEDFGCFWEVKGWMSPAAEEKTRLYRSLDGVPPLVVLTEPVYRIIKRQMGDGRVDL